MIDFAGLLVAAALLVTLVAIEVRRAGPGTGRPPSGPLLGQKVSSRVVMAVLWGLFLLLLLPRVVGLLT